MEDKDKKTSEGWENLNWKEKTTYTKEEVESIKRELSGSHEKWVQKVIWEKKAYQEAISIIPKLMDDKEKLISIHEENPEVAQIILDKIYEWQSIEEFKDAIWYQEDYSDPEVVKKLVSKQAKELRDKEKIEDAKSSFIEKLQMEWDELKNFEEAFAERQELRSFKVSDLDKHLEKAFREVSDNTEQLKDLKKNKEIAKTLATGGWKQGGNSKDTNAKSVQDEAKSFVNTYL